MDSRWTSKTLIEKGWSPDRKYKVTDQEGRVYLLRVTPHHPSDTETHVRKRARFATMERVAATGIPMCRPLEFGQCEEGTYMLLEWIEGVDAEQTVPTLPPAEQYRLGVQSGEILRVIHSLPAPTDAEDWALRFNRKIDRKLEMYTACSLKYEKDQPFYDCIASNRHLLAGRPQSYQHGDYHIGNMMLDKNGIVIIDFDRDDWGDPWEEFNRIVWCGQASSLFASGQVDGYFGGKAPLDFWRLLALYISSNTLSSLPWAIPFGDAEINTMRKQAAEVLAWYSDMTDPVPTWYRHGGAFAP